MFSYFIFLLFLDGAFSFFNNNNNNNNNNINVGAFSFFAWRLLSLVCAGNAFPTQKFLAYFPSAQNSLRNQFLHRFSNHFAVLPVQFSTRGLQILLLSRTERFQYNPCGFALHLDGLMKQGQE